MDIKITLISALKFAEYNPRIMLDDERDYLKKSIEDFGFVNPIVINKDNTIIGGHQRVTVAKEMGITEVPCKVMNLNKKDEKRLNLALNKISGFWDDEKLSDLIFELKEDALGFNEGEIDMYLMQREIMDDTEGSSYDIDNDAELNKLFERNERVGIKVAEPKAPHRKDQIAFFVDNIEEYHKIKSAFKTGRMEELDKDKLLKMIDERA